MASPRVHIWTTAPFVFWEAFSSDSLPIKGLKIAVVIFAGVAIDIDHLSHHSPKTLLKILISRKRKGSVLETLDRPVSSDGVNFFHSLPGMMIFSALALWLAGSVLPVLALAGHMFVDGGNKWNAIVKQSPIPKFLYFNFFLPFCPGLIYESEPIPENLLPKEEDAVAGLAGWIRRCWGIKDDALSGLGGPVIIVPLGYALDSSGALPDAARKTLQMAAAISKAIPEGKIFFVPANVLGPDMQKLEILLRFNLLMGEGVSRRRISYAYDGISSTFGEARAVLRFKREWCRGYATVVIIADWPHTRRAKKIFQFVFKRAADVKVLAMSIEGNWNSGDHPSVKSNGSWLIGNILHYLLVLALGEKADRFQHKYAK